MGFDSSEEAHLRNQGKQDKSAMAGTAVRMLAAVIALLPLTLNAQPEVEIEFISSFGTEGAAPGQFDTLRGITIGNNGEIIVADAGNERIQVCDISGDCFAFGSGGTGPAEFDNPHGVAVDSADRIVTVETNTDRIQIFSSTGEWQQMFGTRGSALGQFRVPGGVWVDASDRILVADENNDRIQICSSAGLCKAFGSFGTAAGQFGTPRAVAVDGDGRILVTERDNARISICDETGVCTFFSGNLPGSGVGQFRRPRELIPDGAGNIIIADGDNHRLQVCTYEGDCLVLGGFGSGPGQFWFPVGVAMDQQSRLYVADQMNHRVQVFRYSAGLFRINAGMNDAWFNPATPGQGFFITVFEDIGIMFLAWFTFDTERPAENVQANLGEPGHRWLTAQGPYHGNTAVLDIWLTQGGVFDTAEPMPVQGPDGQITLEFSDCNAALVSYDISSIDAQGEIPIERIALDNVPACEALQ